MAKRKTPARTARSTRAEDAAADTPARRVPRTTPGAENPADLTTVERLPAEMRLRIDNLLTFRPEPHTSVDEIYKHLNLITDGITRRTFRQYARLVSWRARLCHIGRLVNALVPALPDDGGDAWHQTAHRMLTATLIEALDRPRGAVSVADLARLAKLYADHTPPPAPPSANDQAADPLADDAHLPDKFVDTVRTIYGVTLGPADPPRSAPTKTEPVADAS